MTEKKKDEKDGESAFVFKLNTDNVLFSSSKLGDEAISTTIKITNPTKSVYAFKIKCTSNEMFKIKIPVGYLKPDETVEVALFLLPGKIIPENNKQYFAIYHTKVAGSDTDKPVRDLWKTAKSDAMKRVYIAFKKQAGDKKDEKKDGKKEDKKDEKNEAKAEDGKKDGAKDEERKDDDRKDEKKEEKKEDDDKK